MTLRGACWQHYWQTGQTAAARAVATTGTHIPPTNGEP
jgi:hypothetical protein